MAKTAKQIKISREELEHDEVLELTDKVLFWLRTNSNRIMTVLLLVFVVYAGVVLMGNRREATLMAANDALFGAQDQYERALMSHTWASAERVSQMRAVALEADKIRTDYAGTPIARNALFLKGNAYYFAGDPIGQATNTREAIKAFEEYVSEAKDAGEGFEQAAGLLALGYAYENLYILESDAQATPKALDYYDQVVALPDASFLKWEAKNAQARIHAFAFDDAEKAKALYMEVARARYEKLPDPGPDANQREMVMARIRELAQQFTSASSALIGLQRLGEDIDALREELGS